MAMDKRITDFHPQDIGTQMAIQILVGPADIVSGRRCQEIPLKKVPLKNGQNIPLPKHPDYH
jgi:hypothetical protein